MKKITFIILFFTLFYGCTQETIIADFESGNYEGWIIEGEAFGANPANGNLTGQDGVKGYSGKYLANSFNGKESATGKLLSPQFEIKANYINFLIGGGMKSGTYIELIIDNKTVHKTNSVLKTKELYWMSWDVKEHKGKQARINIVDNEKGSWGYILIDQIEMSNEKKSRITINKKMSFDVTSRYLLIPIQDKAKVSQVSTTVNGLSSTPMDIRLAEDSVDYWTKIDVEQYKGKSIDLDFSFVYDHDIGCSLIKQSDTFEYEYNEKYRPVYHFSAPYCWLNDPNGLIYHDNEYHLFYQFNPYGSTKGSVHWGHAVSKDLMKWKYLPYVLAPDSMGLIYSGGAVVDKNNTAGFGKDALIAIYTAHGDTETQCLAYSIDKGRTFTKYTDNPVLKDSAKIKFRDSKIFWHENSKKWIMVIAADPEVNFYGSSDLKNWKKLSSFGKNIGSHEGVWECPDLFPLSYEGKTKWILLVNISNGGPNGGCATQYFIGDFDGKTFNAERLPYPLWLGYSKDNYAGITWENEPQNRRIRIGWLSNWDYAATIPTQNFRGMMTLPRELSLKTNGRYPSIINYPVKEIETLREEERLINPLIINKLYIIEELIKNNEGAYEIEMDVKLDKTDSFTFNLLNHQNDKLTFLLDIKEQQLSINRSKSGIVDFHPDFAKIISSPITKKSEYKINLFIDKSSVEIFLDKGVTDLAALIFPKEVYNTLIFEVPSGELLIENMKIYKLKNPSK